MKNDPRFKPHEKNPAQIKGHIAGAKTKIKSAQKIAEHDNESAYQLAYEAMLKASLALILSFELRPRSQPGHHIAIIEKAGEILGDPGADMIRVFEEMRRNRNSFLYDSDGFISTSELSDALEIAANFISLVENNLRS